MVRKSILVPALAGTLILGGCHASDDRRASPEQAGVITVEADISLSSPFILSKPYTDAAVKRVGEAVLNQRPGDRVRIVPVGSRSVENAVDAFAMASSQKVHGRAVKKRTEAALADLFASARKAGGNGNTNIVYTIVNSHPVCNPGSSIYVLSDMIESTAEHDIGKDLAAERPIELSKPSEPVFSGGCSIWVIGIGASPATGGGKDPETLPADQLDALKSAWLAWFVAAGADPAKVHFETIL